MDRRRAAGRARRITTRFDRLAHLQHTLQMGGECAHFHATGFLNELMVLNAHRSAGDLERARTQGCSCMSADERSKSATCPAFTGDA